ncbi:unnamed protein product [Rotaria sordida]|uniref:Aminotransferase class I/classII large domain-containing protein n=1 Tax=Rotaria sordida TaxID=392033 RepID=A0A814DLI5_9BILA|nr:unnamed protein product [Rotaria sordida]CAF4156164.1 unnamed protein product [Rotaria sordida]
MSNNSNHSYVKEVAERGVRAYRLLRSYDDDACVNLHHGDCVIPPHPVIRNALREVADKMEIWRETKRGGISVELNRYRVGSLMIMPELREAILDDFCKSMPSTFNRTNAVVHIGGGVTQLVAALFNHFRQSNDIILMFAPTYGAFLCAALTVCSTIRLVKPTSNGQITPEHIEKALDECPEAKGIFLINPNNPTGQYFRKEELEKIAHLIIERDLIVITDEVVHKLVLDTNNKFISMASIEVDGKSMFERTITLRSVSKDHGLAALRLGYAIGSEELMNTVRISWFTYATSFNIDDLAQYLAFIALSYTPDEYYKFQQDLLRCHSDIVITFVEDINRRASYEALKAEQVSAGMFQIIDLSGLRGKLYNETILDDDHVLCELLLQDGKNGVGFFPASCGGYDPRDMKLRLTLSSPEQDISLGMKRLDDFVQKVLRFN